MSILYRLEKNYNRLPDNADYRAVTVARLTADIDRISRRIEADTAFTRGDIIGAVVALKREIINELMDGNNVHLPGIGYFATAVRGKVYEDPHTHHRRLRNPEVRTVRFCPDREMMIELRSAKFENATYRHGTTSVPSPQEVDRVLDELFASKTFITVSDLRAHLNLSHANAYRIAARLEADGRLHDISPDRHKLYQRGEG